MKYNSKKGVTIIEVLVAITIIVLAFGLLAGLSVFSIRALNLINESSQANNLAIEALEVVRLYRDGTDWETDGLGILITNSPYYPIIENNSWRLIQGEENIGIFRRKIIFSEVYRDLNHNISQTGPINDPNTRKVTAIISFRGRELKLSTYLTNWR